MYCCCWFQEEEFDEDLLTCIVVVGFRKRSLTRIC